MMKITNVRTQIYEYEASRMIGDANFPYGFENLTRTDLAVFIDTDEGITGISLSSPVTQPFIHQKGRLLLGRDPRGVRGLWKRMVDSVFKGGNEGIINDAISALDVALWDLKAKINQEPLWKTLGASSRRVRAYASGIDMPLSDTELRTFYEQMARLGISMGKLKVGLDPDQDVQRLGIVQDALRQSGRSPILCIDSNEYWSPKQSIQYITAFEKQYELFWCEEPARRWDYRGLRKVSQSVNAAVATGENLADVSGFMPLIANEAVDIVQVGRNTSGITGAMQVAHLAYAFELPIAMMNCPGHFMAHLAAALPNHIAIEVVFVTPDPANVVTSDTSIEDGYIVLGDAPGHGLHINEDELAKHAVDKPSVQLLSADRHRRGAGLYHVPPEEPYDLVEE
jgi:L-alanine-DL-glutamate epimerase-like enolase superfamily enzyme